MVNFQTSGLEEVLHYTHSDIQTISNVFIKNSQLLRKGVFMDVKV